MYGSNRIPPHLRPPAWHRRAVHVWHSFGEYLHADSERQVENVVWKASSYHLMSKAGSPSDPAGLGPER
jgi:hypothetical protein